MSICCNFYAKMPLLICNFFNKGLTPPPPFWRMLKNCKIGITRHPQERERDMGHRVFSTHALSNCRIECQFEDMNRFVNFFWQFGGRFSHWISHQLPRRKASMVLKLVEKKSAQRRFSLSEWGAASGQATDSWPCRCLPSLLLGKESSLPWQGDSFPDGWTGKVFCHGEGQGQKSTGRAIMTRCQIWCTIEVHRDPISKVLSEW